MINSSDESLIFDARKEGEAGVHVLLASVSSYPYLIGGERQTEASNHYGLEQLSASALSAYSLYEWLIQPNREFERPLHTVRFLSSPTAHELSIRPELNGLGARCDRASFEAAALAWRDDAACDSSNITFFYFAGHGIELDPEDPLLLLQDFKPDSEGMFEEVVSSKSLYRGLAPSLNRQDIATRQFFFLDTCRNYPDDFKNYLSSTIDETARIFHKPLRLIGDYRDTLIVFACGQLERAYAKSNQGTRFSRVLIECLNRDAGTPPKGLSLAQEPSGPASKKWLVTADSLGQAIKHHFAENINQNTKKPQMPNYDIRRRSGSTGSHGTFVVHFMNSEPVVDIHLAVKPPTVLHNCRVKLSRNLSRGRHRVLIDENPMMSNPRTVTSCGGFHSVKAHRNGSSYIFDDANLVTPRTHDWPLMLT